MTDNDPGEIIAEVVEDEQNTDRQEDPSKVRALQRWRPPQYSEEWWRWVSPEIAANRCRAHSSRDGHRCRRPAIAGSTVCRAHGGAAKHVKAAARARLDNAALLMAKNLLGLAVAADSDAVRLGATNSALDRTLGKPVQAIAVGAVEQAPYEEIFEGISTLSREESRAARGLPADDPPSQRDWSNTNQPQSHTATAEPYANQPPNQASEKHTGQGQTYAGYGETDAYVQGRTAARGYDGTGARDVIRQVHHVTGEDALEAAARLAETRGLPSGGHKRYLRP